MVDGVAQHGRLRGGEAGGFNDVRSRRSYARALGEGSWIVERHSSSVSWTDNFNTFRHRWVAGLYACHISGIRHLDPPILELPYRRTTELGVARDWLVRDGRRTGEPGRRRMACAGHGSPPAQVEAGHSLSFEAPDSWKDSPASLFALEHPDC